MADNRRCFRQQATGLIIPISTLRMREFRLSATSTPCGAEGSPAVTETAVGSSNIAVAHGPSKCPKKLLASRHCPAASCSEESIERQDRLPLLPHAPEHAALFPLTSSHSLAGADARPGTQPFTLCHTLTKYCCSSVNGDVNATLAVSVRCTHTHSTANSAAPLAIFCSMCK